MLIDEYDTPIIEHLGKSPETAKANRDVLKSFFGALKSAHLAPLLRFVMLTGISKFSKVSVFSELNNLRDISMLEPYADLPGWTHYQRTETDPNSGAEQVIPWWPADAAFTFSGAAQQFQPGTSGQVLWWCHVPCPLSWASPKTLIAGVII